LFRYFSLVALAYVVATVGAGLADYLTRFELSKTTNLLLSGGVGLFSALALGAIDLAKQGKEEQRPQLTHVPSYPGAPAPYGGLPAPPPIPAGSYRDGPARRRGGAGLFLTVLVLLTLVIGGGYVLTTGVTWAADKLSDIATPPWLNKTKDPGVERLAREVSNTAGPLTITVLSVRVNDQVTMIRVNAKNAGSDALTIPTFATAQLTIPGATLKADPAAGDSSIDVPPAGESFGLIVFDGVLAPGAVDATLSFTQIYGGFDSPRSISVPIPIS
jgi:hypothetical protein